MKYFGKKCGMLCLLVLLMFLTGCKSKEEKVKELMEETMEQRYGVGFEFWYLDPTRNVRNGSWVADMLATDIRGGGPSILVQYYPGEKEMHNKIRDNYYNTKYCQEVTKGFESVFDLQGDYYIYTTWNLPGCTTTYHEGMTYEEAKEEQEFDKDDLHLRVLCAAGEYDAGETVNAIVAATEKTERDNLTVSIWMYTKKELESEAYRIKYEYNRPQLYTDALDEVGSFKKKDGHVVITDAEKAELVARMIVMEREKEEE